METNTLETAFETVKRHVEERHGISVQVVDVLKPNTGDFNGSEIKVDPSNDADAALFTLAHLFGHTVQWATDERLRWLGTTYATSAPPEVVPELMAYENDACRLALAVLHEAGIRSLDQWLADWTRADWRYLDNYYRTGERGNYKRFWVAGSPLLEPLPIPAFKPGKWESRFSF